MQENDWRLFNDVKHLYHAYINPTDGEEICQHMPEIKKCVFCWDLVEDNLKQVWYVPEDLSCCICESCYKDFCEMFQWNMLDGWDMEWDKKEKL